MLNGESMQVTYNLKDGSVVRWLKGSGFISMVGRTAKSPTSLAIYTMKVQDDAIFIEFLFLGEKIEVIEENVRG